MAYYMETLKRLQDEKKKKKIDEVYVVEDEKGTNVNQDRVKMDTVMKPIQQKLDAMTSYRISGMRSVAEEEDKWYEKILQVPEVFKGNLDRFDDGWQAGDVIKTAAETVGDTILTVGGTAGDLGLGVVKGILNVGEGIGDAISYAGAQVLDWVGKDEKADEIRERASKDIFNEAFKKPQSFVDKASILGDTGDKVSEGIGYMASIWASGNIGGMAGTAIGGTTKAAQIGSTVGQSSLIFANSTGTNMADIYDQYGVEGVTDGEAWGKSLGSAAIETTTEQLFGMFGKADTRIVNSMTNRAKTALGKVIMRAGGQAAGEGAEEVISYASNYVWDRVVDAASNGEGATFAQQWSWEEMWEQAGIAAITALAMSGGQTSASALNNKTATNTWSDALNETARQQDVSAKLEELEDQKAELEKELGQNLSQTDIDEIFTEMQQIDNQISELNNTLTNTTIQDNKAQIEGLQNAIAEKTQELQKSQDVREKQIIEEQINNLQEELNEATNAQTITDESKLRRQNFTYEAQETDSDVRKALYESASKYMNNTTRSHEFADIVAKIAEDTNTSYEFTNTEGLKELGHDLENVTVNGLVTNDGKVLINIDSNKALNTILGHETTHLLEGTQEYQALQDMVIEYAKEKGIYEDRVNNLQKLYQGTKADVNAELTSDLVGELLFTDQSFVESLSVQQPTVFQKIYDYIKHIYKMATAGSKEARQLEELKYKFDKAYKAQGKQTSTDTKFSVSATDNLGRTLTKEQQEFFKDSKVRDENGNLLTVYHGSNSEFTVFDLSKGGQSNTGAKVGFWFTETKEGADNFANDVWYGDKKPNTKEVYLNIKNPKIYENVENGELQQQYKNEAKQLEEQAKEIASRYSWRNTDNYKIIMTFDNFRRDYQMNDFSVDPIELAKARGISEEQARKILDDAKQYNEISNKAKQVENEYYKLAYSDAYEQFKIDLYEMAGQNAEEANTGGLGMALKNPQETVALFRNKLISEGYDGIVIKDTDFDSGNFNGTNNQYVAFYPEQIKNVDNTNPTSNPDIRYSLSEDNSKAQRAKTQFGITTDLREAGYLTTDGKYIDLSGKNNGGTAGIRSLDHRDIGEIYTDEEYSLAEKKYSNMGTATAIMQDFIEEGNIRLIPGQGVDIAVEPTAEQYEKLYDYLSYIQTVYGDVLVDLETETRNRENLEYNDRVSVSKMINDIKNHYSKYSLSAKDDIAPVEGWKVSGEDLKLQVEEAIAPLQETIENLTEQVQTLQENIIPTTEQYKEVQPTQPTLEEVQNLMDIRDNKSGSEYARAFFALRDKYGQVELYKSLNEYYSTGTVTQPNTDIDTAPVSQEVVEKLGQEAFNTITDEQAPSFEDTVFEALDSGDFEYSSTEHIPSPLDSRDIDEVGNRKVKAYQYEHPDVKPYFQEEAQNMLYDLDNTIKGERGAAIDELGNYEYYGITRQTTEAIAYLKDNYGYSYDQIRKGLNAIIEDDGKENNAVSKRIEFMLDERLREGYTTSDGIPIPANEDYINFLNEKQITQYNQEAFNALTDEDVPLYEVIEPPKSTTAIQETQTENNIPMARKTAQNENMDVSEGKQRKWIKTSTESEVVNREILPDDLDQTKIMYQPITNKNTLVKANFKLDTLGYKKAVEYFNNQVFNKKISVEDIALGERLIQEAIRNKDTKTAGELIQNVAILGTELGQKVQALSIIQRMTPEGQLKMLEKTINRGKTKGDKAFDGVELTDDMRQKILDSYKDDGSYSQEELNKAVEEVKQQIADEMPSTFMDKVNTWRYLSMLGNPKTHIRNLVSNVAMKGTVAVKNAIARTLETIAPIENRTKTWRAASQEVKDFAKQTTLEMKDIISGDSKYNETADIKSKRKIFKSKLLNTLSDGNSNLLSNEDWWFSKGAFENSFSEFLTANGITTQEDIKNNAELIEKGKQYALEQSQIATFRQYSWLANKIGDIERKNAATQIAVGAVIPFKKTPINIAKTGLSYSPLGFAKTLTYDIAQVKKGNMQASTLIDHIAQNTVGSALTLVGYMLAKAGFLNGAGDDDKEGKYDYQLGKQAYSINIGGNTYTLSWLTPVAMPLFVGANAYEQLVEGEEWNADVVIETLGQTLDPLSEMSFLSSLDSVLSSYDSGIQKFFGIGEAALQNYVTQFIPTVSSQLAATMDDTKRTTKVSGDSTFKFGEELYNQIIYKIPGLRETLEPSTDIWGNEIKQSEDLLQRAFENFISPYARKESIATEIDEELKDLFSQTGDNGILPNIPSNYVNYNGEKYNMSAEEYTDYKKTYGQTANDLLEDLFRTATYGRATAEERTEMVNKVYDYARDEAKLEYLGKEGVEYTNTTEDGEEVYKENLIKGAIENDMSIDEYKLYLDDPEEYSFLKEKDYSYRRKYFDTNNSLKEIEETFNEQKEGIDDDDELDVLYSEKKTSIINIIVDSGLEDTEKASLYKKYYNSDAIDTIVKASINVDDYLIYETKEFKADKNEKGNSIPGSRKDKVIDYVNTLDMSIAQKAILIKSTNTFKFNDYNAEIVEYVSSLNLEYEDMVNILEDLDMTVKGDMVYWE